MLLGELAEAHMHGLVNMHSRETDDFAETRKGDFG